MVLRVSFFVTWPLTGLLSSIMGAFLQTYLYTTHNYRIPKKIVNHTNDRAKVKGLFRLGIESVTRCAALVHVHYTRFLITILGRKIKENLIIIPIYLKHFIN